MMTGIIAAAKVASSQKKNTKIILCKPVITWINSAANAAASATLSTHSQFGSRFDVCPAIQSLRGFRV